MATMILLDPAPEQQLPVEGWCLLASQAGRYAVGLRVSVEVWNSEVQCIRQVARDYPTTWTDLLGETTRLLNGATDGQPAVEGLVERLNRILLTLLGDVEGALRAAESRTEGERESQATLLVQLAAEAELFHTRDQDAFATYPIGGHRETSSLRGKGFRLWLRQRFHDTYGKTPGSQAVQDALGVLEGKALFKGTEIPVYVRLAEHDGAIYLDLADAQWRAVKITTSGWEVIHDPPVKFRRPRGMLPLPDPQHGGSLDALRDLVNVPDASSWRLIKAFVVQLLNPHGPYVILIVHGEQGSTKSTLCRVLKRLVDPNKADLRAAPREERDLAIAANNSWVVAYDNLTHLPDWLNDALCRLSTGSGFGTRELFSDDDEILFDSMRPVVINGIEELAQRGDLLDRGIVEYMPALAKGKKRQAEKTFWKKFSVAHPALPGAVLDAVSTALRNSDHEEADDAIDLPRMADFAAWVIAACPALGMTSEEFLAA
jgi:hypothetical protein